MRKFSKKIAMMMVLAMLVSLFSGIVSASAASMWSAKSVDDDNYAVVMGETIEVKKGEFINFDLFKNDVEATEAGYTYTWESSDAEVLFINGAQGAKNGYARVKGEVGEKATISVSFTNLATGVTVKTPRTFNVVVVEELKADEAEVEYDIVAKFGEESFVAGKEEELAAVVTADGKEVEAKVVFAVNGKAIEGKYVPAIGDAEIVITATVAGKTITETVDIVVEEAVAAEFIDAKQTALNAVEIILSSADWATKATADGAITAAQVIGGIEISETIKSVEVKKDAADTVVVTFYNNLVADATYKFALVGTECAKTVVGAGLTPAAISVTSGKVPTNTIKQVEVKVYNAAGFDITSLVSGTVTFALVGENNDCDVQIDGSIYFFEKDKAATVEATYDMGYDKDGNEITDLKATGSFVSVAESTDTGLLGYALSIDGKEAKDLTYGNATLEVSLSDSGRKVYATYKQVSYDDKKTDKYVVDGDSATYTYHSTNDSVVIVDPATGTLYPCSEGYASVYLKKGDDVVGSVSVKIKPARKLDIFTATTTDSKLATAIANDSIEIAVATKDQYTDAYNVPAEKYTVVLDTTVEKNGQKATLADFFTVTKDLINGKIKLTLAASAANFIDKDAVQALQLTVKAEDPNNATNVKSQKLTVSIRDNAEYAGTKNTALKVSANEIDTALNKKALSDYAATITLVSTDDKLYDLGKEDIAFEASATTGSAYSVVITKVGDNEFNATTCGFFTLDGQEIKINPVKDATTKLANGTYKVQLYKRSADGLKMQAIRSETIVVKDSTPKAVVKVVSTDINKNIKDAVEVYINGAKVDADKYEVVVKEAVNNVSGKLYVKTVTVTLNTTALNKDSVLNLTIVQDVAINTLFK